jgi:hypothetical protein
MTYIGIFLCILVGAALGTILGTIAMHRNGGTTKTLGTSADFYEI